MKTKIKLTSSSIPFAKSGECHTAHCYINFADIIDDVEKAIDKSIHVINMELINGTPFTFCCVPGYKLLSNDVLLTGTGIEIKNHERKLMPISTLCDLYFNHFPYPDTSIQYDNSDEFDHELWRRWAIIQLANDRLMEGNPMSQKEQNTVKEMMEPGFFNIGNAEEDVEFEEGPYEEEQIAGYR